MTLASILVVTHYPSFSTLVVTCVIYGRHHIYITFYNSPTREDKTEETFIGWQFVPIRVHFEGEKKLQVPTFINNV